MESNGVMYFSLFILALAATGLCTLLFIAYRVLRGIRSLLTPSAAPEPEMFPKPTSGRSANQVPARRAKPVEPEEEALELPDETAQSITDRIKWQK